MPTYFLTVVLGPGPSAFGLACCSRLILSAARLVRRGYRVRVVIDKKEYPTIRSWKPLRLDRLKPGVHHATIDLLDRRGTKTHTALNRTDRVFLIR